MNARDAWEARAVGCLSGAVVQSLASGELARPAAADAAHLESCASCRDRVALAKGTLQTAAPATTPVDLGSAATQAQPDSPFWPIVLTRVGHAQLELGDHESAIATIDRANTLVDTRPDTDPKTKAEIRILFARALKQGGDKTRWIKLAREARALHASFPVPDAEVLAWIDDFLAGTH